MTSLESLQDLLIEEFGLERTQLDPGAELGKLGVDSLDLLELMFKIEDKYRLAIRDDIPGGLTTVGDVVRYIDDLVARRDAAGAAAGADGNPVS